MTRQGLSFRPTVADPLHDFVRGLTALAVAHLSLQTASEVAAERYGDAGDMVLRAATSPASLTGWGSPLAPAGVGPFLSALKPRSAAAVLFERAARVSLAGLKTVDLPQFSSPLAPPSWLAEGQAYPVISGVLGDVTLGPPKKLGFISVLTAELAAIDDAEGVIRTAMLESGAAALDGAVFDTAAATALRPAGLLNGLTALPAAPGGGLEAMTADVAAMAAAIASAGGGAELLLVVNPGQAVSVRLLAPGDIDIAASAAIPPGRAILLDPAAVASAFTGLPLVDVSREALIHEDTAPAAIGTPGSPNAVAAPTRSLWQTDSLALRSTWPSAWVRRGSGLIAYIEDVTW